MTEQEKLTDKSDILNNTREYFAASFRRGVEFVAANMLVEGLDIDLICRVTRLEKEKVEELKALGKTIEKIA